jgi:hypothetical protein
MGEVTLTLVGLPPGSAAPPVKVPGDQATAKVTLNLKPNVKPAPLLLTVQGAAKHGGRDWAVRAAPVTLTVKR